MASYVRPLRYCCTDTDAGGTTARTQVTVAPDCRPLKTGTATVAGPYVTLLLETLTGTFVFCAMPEYVAVFGLEHVTLIVYVPLPELGALTLTGTFMVTGP